MNGDGAALARRRAWFEQHARPWRSDAGQAGSVGHPASRANGRVFHTCPCCGYPTLPRRGWDVICVLCYWEDDGQDDPHADEVSDGPNKRYSLSEARENFVRHLVMYSPDRDSRFSRPDYEEECTAKREVIRAFEAVMETFAADPALDSDSPMSEDTWRVVEEKLAALRRAFKKRFRGLGTATRRTE